MPKFPPHALRKFLWLIRQVWPSHSNHNKLTYFQNYFDKVGSLFFSKLLWICVNLAGLQWLFKTNRFPRKVFLSIRLEKTHIGCQISWHNGDPIKCLIIPLNTIVLLWHERVSGKSLTARPWCREKLYSRLTRLSKTDIFSSLAFPESICMEIQFIPAATATS